MKNYSLILIGWFTCLMAAGQSKYEREARELFWGASDTQKNNVEVPAMWSNESAVILYKNDYFYFQKSGKKVKYRTATRRRIKLLDKVSVLEFSEFAYQKEFYSSKGSPSLFQKKGETVFAVKIVKSDGKEIEVDVKKEAVVVDGETKIAISNLEIGDVIDYFIYVVEPFSSKDAFGFEPVETVISQLYPIVSFKLSLKTEKDFFVNFNSLNGAPELLPVPTDTKGVRHYELTADTIDAYENKNWFYPLIELPAYKFQVYFARSSKYEAQAMAFLSEKEEIIKTQVSQDEVLKFYDGRLRPFGDLSGLRKYMKKKDFASDQEKVAAAFYFVRHYYYTRYIEFFYFYNRYYYEVMFTGKRNLIESEKDFLKLFTVFLKSEDIDYDILLAKPIYDGTLDNLLIERNLRKILRVNLPEPMYIQWNGEHTTINEIPTVLEGMQNYCLSVHNYLIDTIKKEVLPDSKQEENYENKNVTVQWSKDFSEIRFDVKRTYLGALKKDFQNECLIMSDFVSDEYIKYDTDTLSKIGQYKSRKREIDVELKREVENLKKQQKTYLEKRVAYELGVETVDGYTYAIPKTGRFHKDSTLVFEESFVVKEKFIKRAGPNYIVEIGCFIGQQIDFTEKERNRKEHVYLTSKRSFENTISMPIPEGYELVGLEKLNQSVANDIGSFESSFRIEEGSLLVDTKKIYEKKFVPNEHWNSMLDFLDAATEFSRVKIMLKRKE